MMIWIKACSVLATGFAALLVKLYLLKRDIRQLSNKLSDIAHTDTNARLMTQTADASISQLTQSINLMLEKNRFEHFGVVRTEAQLKRAITNISHDLRTPLTAARGYLQMLESTELDAATEARYLEIVRGRLDSLGSLMDDLFEFARVIEGNATLTMQEVNIGNALRDALSEAYGALERNGFTVEVHIPDAAVLRVCDPDALRRVLQNLLKNVCAHGKEHLRVSLTEETIEISNRADGLDKLETAHMFERFYTSDASRNNQNTGLGLAIVKELTERMGGQLSARKEGDMLSIQLVLPQREQL